LGLQNVLAYVQALRNLIPLEDQKAKEHYDDWIVMLREWCEAQNEKWFPKATHNVTELLVLAN
jgi:hypothetical protein